MAKSGQRFKLDSGDCASAGLRWNSSHTLHSHMLDLASNWSAALRVHQTSFKVLVYVCSIEVSLYVCGSTKKFCEALAVQPRSKFSTGFMGVA